MTTDYHQKPIDSMTPGELRAYRRELARAALTGFCANPYYVSHQMHEISDNAFSQAIEHISIERKQKLDYSDVQRERDEARRIAEGLRDWQAEKIRQYGQGFKPEELPWESSAIEHERREEGGAHDQE